MIPLKTPAMIACLVLSSGAMRMALGQSGADACSRGAGNSVAFEVAAIREADPKVPEAMGPVVYPGGRVVIRREPLTALIQIAYGLGYWQIAGDEGWMEKAIYDVEAKPPEGILKDTYDIRYTNVGIEDEHLRQMLQALLVDRFRLKCHYSERIGKTYFLERSSKPLRLRPTHVPNTDEQGSESVGRSGDIGFASGRWVLFNTSTRQLAQFASRNILRAPVLDRTSLHGSFDYSQESPLKQDETDYRDLSNSFIGLLDELGLLIKQGRGTVDTFVIDHVEKPTPN